MSCVSDFIGCLISTRLPVQGPEGRVADSAIILGQARVQ